jgi:SAM-dependent methyltransferase
MTEYGPSTYGDRVADVYDRMPQVVARDVDRAVVTLAELAGPGPVLELGIGTGRLALPLAARGLAVHGIDASEAIVKKLRVKSGGERIPVAIGDFADVAVDGRFPLIFVAFNTFFGLLSQEEQVRCFARVAEHLTAEGVFVLEAFVPDVTRFDRGQRLGVTHMGVDDVQLEASVHDPLTQRIRSLHIMMSNDGGPQLYPVHIRYAWPSELDLMARLAGLHLRARWSDWDKSTFTATSRSHVSVYACSAGR